MLPSATLGGMEGPRTNTPRPRGVRLTPHEHALLERVCAGSWRGAEEARAQLAHARWGGKDHAGDACFLVDVPALAGLPRIPPHEGGPIVALEVVDGDDLRGTLELWVHDGRLHSLDYSTFGETDVEALPEVRLVVGDA
jgi:hypothetical protein